MFKKTGTSSNKAEFINRKFTIYDGFKPVELTALELLETLNNWIKEGNSETAIEVLQDIEQQLNEIGRS